MLPAPGADAAELKRCCAALYDAQEVRWLLGDELHPGGSELTLRAAALAGVGRGTRVLDVASGEGATARLLAGRLGAHATGIEYGEAAVERSAAAAAAAGLDGSARFVQGDAERLPFDPASFDVAICECSLCLFPDKAGAVAEMARVLRPGGRAAIADVTVELGELTPALRGAAAQVACVADARPRDEYVRLLEAAGLKLVHSESHAPALERMVDRVEARLRVARMAARASGTGEWDPELALALELSGEAREAVRRGSIGYELLVAELA